MKTNSKSYANIVLTGVIIALVVVLGYVVFANNQSSPDLVGDNGNGGVIEDDVPNDNLQGWSAYTSPTYGFMFMYPPEFRKQLEEVTLEGAPQQGFRVSFEDTASPQTTFNIYVNPFVGIGTGYAPYKSSEEVSVADTATEVSFMEHETRSNQLLLSTVLTRNGDRYVVYLFSEEAKSVAENVFLDILSTFQFIN